MQFDGRWKHHIKRYVDMKSGLEIDAIFDDYKKTKFGSWAVERHANAFHDGTE